LLTWRIARSAARASSGSRSATCSAAPARSAMLASCVHDIVDLPRDAQPLFGDAPARLLLAAS
jgi:hypothetical protein